MTDVRQESLASLLGGRGGALDASLPPLAFVAGWLIWSHSIGAGAVAAVLCGLVIGVTRVVRGEKPRAVILSVLLVVAAALVALYTGRVEDFFLIQLLSNVASALGRNGTRPRNHREANRAVEGNGVPSNRATVRSAASSISRVTWWSS